jgi:hypothetical protein
MNISFPLIIIPKIGFVIIIFVLVLDLFILEIKSIFVIIYLVFIKSSQVPVEYKLYNSWTLDNTLDIYVYNNLGRSKYAETRATILDNILYSGKTAY